MTAFCIFQLDKSEKKIVEISYLYPIVGKDMKKKEARRESLSKIRDELKKLQLKKKHNTRKKGRIDKEIKSLEQFLQPEEVNQSAF